MAEITSGLSSYQWTDYDEKINTSEKKTVQKGTLKEDIKADKITDTEIKDSKREDQNNFNQVNPDVILDKGIPDSKLRSADNSPVEINFNTKAKDRPGELAKTKEVDEKTATVDSNTQVPESLKFKDYKNNNFDEAAKLPQNKENFSKGSVTLIKEAKVIEAIGGEPETSNKETIQHFQSSIGLADKDVDGKFGPKTMSALAEKYTTALNKNPSDDTNKAELTRLGSVIDKLQPIFESTKVGDDLKLLRSAISSSDKTEAAKKVINDKKETAQVAENKLVENIGSPPAKNLTGTELIDNLPDDNQVKIAFKAMYSSEIKDGKTNWTLKPVNDIGESLKGASPEVIAKALTSLGSKDSEIIIKKMPPREAKAAVDAMKPKDAAKIFDNMNLKEAIPILITGGQDKTKTAAIIAEMQPNNAKKLLESTAKSYTAWTNSVKNQINTDKEAKSLDSATNKTDKQKAQDLINKFAPSFIPNHINMADGGNSETAKLVIDDITKNLSKEQLLELKSQLEVIPHITTTGGGANGAKKSISESVDRRLAELDKKLGNSPSSLKDMREKFESSFKFLGDGALENKAKEDMKLILTNLSDDDLNKMEDELDKSPQSRGTVSFKNTLINMIKDELMTRLTDT